MLQENTNAHAEAGQLQNSFTKLLTKVVWRPYKKHTTNHPAQAASSTQFSEGHVCCKQMKHTADMHA